MLRPILILVAVALLFSVQAPIRATCLATVDHSFLETCQTATGEQAQEHSDDLIDDDPILTGLPSIELTSSPQMQPLAHSGASAHRSRPIAPAEQPPRWS